MRPPAICCNRAFPFDQQLLTIVFRVPENINYTAGHITFVPSVAGAKVTIRDTHETKQLHIIRTAISNRFQQGIENGDDLAGFSISAMYFNEFTESWFDVFRVRECGLHRGALVSSL